MLGLFIQLEELLGRIEERGWIVECVAWRDVDIEGEGIHENYLFQVTPTVFTIESVRAHVQDFLDGHFFAASGTARTHSTYGHFHA